jgi:hypothetical protein
MSRILRRPMFRGGRVSSYGTGIAAPLVPGYQGGGQIGGGIIYGKPMADGRYGFADLEIDESTIGGNVFEQAKEKVKTPISEADLLKITQEREYLEEPVKLTDEYIREKFEDAVLKNKRNVETGGISETDLAYGMQIAMPVSGVDADFYKAIGQDKEGTYELWRKGKIPGLGEKDWNTAQAAQEKKYDINLSDRPDKPEVDPDQKWKDEIARLNAIIAGGTEEPEVDAKTAVAENKELFRDLLGYDKAKGQDISDMLLGFAGAEGDDTWSKAKSFFRDEAKRPGRAQKISDAAGTLAIQDYIAGKRSKEQIEKLKGIETFKLDEQIKRLYPQADDEWVTALRKGAGKDGSLSSDSTIKSALAPRLREGPDKGKALNTSISKKDLPEIQKDKDDFKIGLTIVTLKGGQKVIVEKTATDIKIREDLPIF